MKLLVFRVNTKQNNRKQLNKINMEKVLITIFFISFSALVIVQGILLDPSVRASLIVEEVLGGTPLGTEETLYNEGIIVLGVNGKLPDDSSGESILVLINGESAARFTEKKMKLQVIDGDVIEIDGSNYSQRVEVVIQSCSDNISSEYLGKAASVFSNVKKLAKIRIPTQNPH